LREVLERSSSVAIVAVSQQAARSDVFRLRDYGVHTYLEKPIDPAVLHRSLVTLSSCGESAPRAADRIGVGMWVMDRLIEETLNDYTARYRLSNAEVEVLRCAVAGKNRADIARDRSVSTNTVKTQIRALLAKSGHATLHDLVIAFQAMVQQSDVRRSAASFSSSSPPLRAVAP
jgi:DNA-binding NarL/FixJ family response regulator